MKQIIDFHAYDFFPAADGIVVVEKHDDDANKHVRYTFVSSTIPGVTRPITKSTFLAAKYRQYYEQFSKEIENYLLVKAVWMDSDHLMLMMPTDGSAKVLDIKGKVVWQGNLSYQGEPPRDVALYQGHIWAAFSEANALIRFSTRTFRPELKVGGKGDHAFSGPENMWVDEEMGRMIICNGKEYRLVELDLNTFQPVDVGTFKEPILKYGKVGGMEYILTDSGLYQI